jgi:cytidyltransferase-like protein
VGGVFDLLHPGHIHTLKSAKSFGDVLVVVVATTSTALKLKKNRDIYHDEKQRQELVASLSFVDLSIIGKEGTLYDTVSFVKPDIIALGYDQKHDEKEVQKNCLERGMELDVIRLSSPIPRIKSTMIKRSLGNSFYDI